MKKLTIIVIALLVVIGVKAQKTETRNFGEFHSVYFFGNINVEMIKSDSNYAVLTAGPDLELGSITTELNKGQLFVRNTGIGDDKVVKVKFYYKSIDELIAKAGVELTSANTFDIKIFSIRFSKGAIAKIDVKCQELKAIVIQGSELSISGSVDKINVSTNTGAVFHGYKLKTKDSWLRSVTGGKIEISLTGEMEASANTGGMVYFKGNPKVVSQKVITGGVIEKKN
jgi:hypothetical protein